MTDNFTKIQVEKDGAIGKIILSCPQTLNIIEKETFQEINRVLDDFDHDNSVKVVLFEGICGISRSGKRVFSAGINLKKYKEKIELVNTNPVRFKGELKMNRVLPARIENMHKPVVIGIDGFVTGGFFEIAMACDAIILSNTAVLSLNEVNLGLIPGFGGMHKLLRLVGKNRAFDIISTCRQISAEEALELGIAVNVVKKIDFEKKLIQYCEKLASKPLSAISLVKDSIRRVSLGENIEEVEIENFMKAISSEEAQIGIQEFLENKNLRRS